jgi:hypothetical protein
MLLGFNEGKVARSCGAGPQQHSKTGVVLDLRGIGLSFINPSNARNIPLYSAMITPASIGFRAYTPIPTRDRNSVKPGASDAKEFPQVPLSEQLFLEQTIFSLEFIHSSG